MDKQSNQNNGDEASQEQASVKLKQSQDEQAVEVKVVNALGEEVFFKIKRGTPMKRLITAYCSRIGATESSLRFLYDGTRVAATDTPGTLDIEDGDIIDVLTQQTGGWSSAFV